MRTDAREAACPTTLRPCLHGSVTSEGGAPYPASADDTRSNRFNAPQQSGVLVNDPRFKPRRPGDCFTSQRVSQRAGPVAWSR
jgi:hypothetical protein